MLLCAHCYGVDIVFVQLVAGLPTHKVVQLSGRCTTAQCASCGKCFDERWLRDTLGVRATPKCSTCGSVLMPTGTGVRRSDCSWRDRFSRCARPLGLVTRPFRCC